MIIFQPTTVTTSLLEDANLSLAASDPGRMIFSFPGTAYGFVSMMTGAMRG